jgi:hypothetical protein
MVPPPRTFFNGDPAAVVRLVHKDDPLIKVGTLASTAYPSPFLRT